MDRAVRSLTKPKVLERYRADSTVSSERKRSFSRQHSRCRSYEKVQVSPVGAITHELLRPSEPPWQGLSPGRESVMLRTPGNQHAEGVTANVVLGLLRCPVNDAASNSTAMHNRSLTGLTPDTPRWQFALTTPHSPHTTPLSPPIPPRTPQSAPTPTPPEPCSSPPNTAGHAPADPPRT